MAIFLKKCQVFSNFLTFNWQISGGSRPNVSLSHDHVRGGPKCVLGGASGHNWGSGGIPGGSEGQAREFLEEGVPKPP